MAAIGLQDTGPLSGTQSKRKIVPDADDMLQVARYTDESATAACLR